MGLKVKIKPAGLALDIAEAKRHLGIHDNSHDERVKDLIAAASACVENETGRALLSQTFVFTLDCFPAVVRLPRPPLVSISHIKYVDQDGDLVTLAEESYRVTEFEEPAKIEPAYGSSWPSPLSVSEAVQIEYIAGYGASHGAIPDTLKHAMKLLIGEWDQMREGVVFGASSPIPNNAMRLMRSERVGGLFVGSGTSQ